MIYAVFSKDKQIVFVFGKGSTYARKAEAQLKVSQIDPNATITPIRGQLGYEVHWTS